MKKTPFYLRISDEELSDLHQRLRQTRWINEMQGIGASEGIDMTFLKKLVDYWQHDFDWRAQEEKINRFDHFKAEVAGQRIHFIHQHGTGHAPMPLILTHGWPGSFVEMLDIIPLLTNPAAYGGDPTDSFDVIVPSLPGYGFSAAPEKKGIGPYEIAALWAELMSGLGYQRFAVQGGDFGATVSTWLASRYPERVAGIHLNYISGSYSPPLGEGQPPITKEEKQYLDHVLAWSNQHAAYGRIQSTKPQSLAVGLNDSPAGLAAWIAEKFHAWTDNNGNVEDAVSYDALLTNISLYWFTQTIGSSFRMYVEGSKHPMHFSAGECIKPPLGVALFPAELPMPPKSWVGRCYNIQRWEKMSKGGHFAALENPQALAKEICEFFRPLRSVNTHL